MKIDFRKRAQDHLAVSNRILTVDDATAQIAAAAHLRMAIECVAYELLQTLEDDVSGPTMETWQPGKLIKELKEIDALIESDRVISMGIEEEFGSQAKDMRSLGTDARLSASWISSSWYYLSGLLHERTISQHRNEKPVTPERTREKLGEISSELTRVLSSPLFATDFKLNVNFCCTCGFRISRREELLRRDEHVVCPKCATSWGAREIDGSWRFWERHFDVKCLACKEIRIYSVSLLKEGAQLQCENCGSILELRQGWSLRLVQDNSKGE